MLPISFLSVIRKVTNSVICTLNPLKRRPCTRHFMEKNVLLGLFDAVEAIHVWIINFRQ